MNDGTWVTEITISELIDAEWRTDSSLMNEGVENFTISINGKVIGMLVNANSNLYEDFFNALSNSIKQNEKNEVSV